MHPRSYLKVFLINQRTFVAREAGNRSTVYCRKFGEQIVSVLFDTIPVILQLVGDKKSGAA